MLLINVYNIITNNCNKNCIFTINITKKLPITVKSFTRQVLPDLITCLVLCLFISYNFHNLSKLVSLGNYVLNTYEYVSIYLFKVF